ncbi:hypothetical protein P9112_008691 [Eukaryota sp. TZLM1-RC]
MYSQIQAALSCDTSTAVNRLIDITSSLSKLSPDEFSALCNFLFKLDLSTIDGAVYPHLSTLLATALLQQPNPYSHLISICQYLSTLPGAHNIADAFLSHFPSVNQSLALSLIRAITHISNVQEDLLPFVSILGILCLKVDRALFTKSFCQSVLIPLFEFSASCLTSTVPFIVLKKILFLLEQLEVILSDFTFEISVSDDLLSELVTIFSLIFQLFGYDLNRLHNSLSGLEPSKVVDSLKSSEGHTGQNSTRSLLISSLQHLIAITSLFSQFNFNFVTHLIPFSCYLSILAARLDQFDVSLLLLNNFSTICQKGQTLEKRSVELMFATFNHLVLLSASKPFSLSNKIQQDSLFFFDNCNVIAADLIKSLLKFTFRSRNEFIYMFHNYFSIDCYPKIVIISIYSKLFLVLTELNLSKIISGDLIIELISHLTDPADVMSLAKSLFLAMKESKLSISDDHLSKLLDKSRILLSTDAYSSFNSSLYVFMLELSKFCAEINCNLVSFAYLNTELVGFFGNNNSNLSNFTSIRELFGLLLVNLPHNPQIYLSFFFRFFYFNRALFKELMTFICEFPVLEFSSYETIAYSTPIVYLADLYLNLSETQTNSWFGRVISQLIAHQKLFKISSRLNNPLPSSFDSSCSSVVSCSDSIFQRLVCLLTELFGDLDNRNILNQLVTLISTNKSRLKVFIFKHISHSNIEVISQNAYLIASFVGIVGKFVIKFSELELSFIDLSAEFCSFLTLAFEVILSIFAVCSKSIYKCNSPIEKKTKCVMCSNICQLLLNEFLVLATELSYSLLLFDLLPLELSIEFFGKCLNHAIFIKNIEKVPSLDWSQVSYSETKSLIWSELPETNQDLSNLAFVLVLSLINKELTSADLNFSIVSQLRCLHPLLLSDLSSSVDLFLKILNKEELTDQDMANIPEDILDHVVQTCLSLLVVLGRCSEIKTLSSLPSFSDLFTNIWELFSNAMPQYIPIEDLMAVNSAIIPLLTLLDCENLVTEILNKKLTVSRHFDCGKSELSFLIATYHLHKYGLNFCPLSTSSNLNTLLFVIGLKHRSCDPTSSFKYLFFSEIPSIKPPLNPVYQTSLFKLKKYLVSPSTSWTDLTNVSPNLFLDCCLVEFVATLNNNMDLLCQVLFLKLNFLLSKSPKLSKIYDYVNIAKICRQLSLIVDQPTVKNFLLVEALQILQKFFNQSKLIDVAIKRLLEVLFHDLLAIDSVSLIKKMIFTCPLAISVNFHVFFSHLVSKLGSIDDFSADFLFGVANNVFSTSNLVQFGWFVPSIYCSSSTKNVGICDFITKLRHKSPIIDDIITFRLYLNSLVNDSLDMVHRAGSSFKSLFKSCFSDLQLKLKNSSYSKLSDLAVLAFAPFLSRGSKFSAQLSKYSSDSCLFNSFVTDFNHFVDTLKSTIQEISSKSDLSRVQLLQSRLNVLFESIHYNCSKPLKIDLNSIEIKNLSLPLLFINGLFTTAKVISIEPFASAISTQTLPRVISMMTSSGDVSFLIKPSDPSSEITANVFLSLCDSVLTLNNSSNVYSPLLVGLPSNSDLHTSSTGSFMLPGNSIIRTIVPFTSPNHLSKSIKSQVKSLRERWNCLAFLYSTSMITDSLWNSVDSYMASAIASWLIGLGDRHLGNSLITPHGKDNIFVNIDFGQVLNSSKFLPVPEVISARLSPIIIRSFPYWKRHDYIRDISANFYQYLINSRHLFEPVLNIFKSDPPNVSLALINKYKGVSSICEGDLNSFSELLRSLFVSVKTFLDTKDQLDVSESKISSAKISFSSIREQYKESREAVDNLISHVSHLSTLISSDLCSKISDPKYEKLINEIQYGGLSALAKVSPIAKSTNISQKLPPGLFVDPSTLLSQTRKLVSSYQSIIKMFGVKYFELVKFELFENELGSALDCLQKSDIDQAEILIQSSFFKIFHKINRETCPQLYFAFDLFSQNFRVSNTQFSYFGFQEVEIQVRRFLQSIPRINRSDLINLITSLIDLARSKQKHINNDATMDFIVNYSILLDVIKQLLLYAADLSPKSLVFSKIFFKGFSLFMFNLLYLVSLACVFDSFNYFELLLPRIQNLIQSQYFDKELAALCSDIVQLTDSEIWSVDNLFSAINSTITKYLETIRTHVPIFPEFSVSPNSSHKKRLHDCSMSHLEKLKSTVSQVISNSELLTLFVSSTWFSAHHEIVSFLKNWPSFGIDFQPYTHSFFLKSLQNIQPQLEGCISNPLLSGDVKNQLLVALDTVSQLLSFESVRCGINMKDLLAEFSVVSQIFADFDGSDHQRLATEVREFDRNLVFHEEHSASLRCILDNQIELIQSSRDSIVRNFESVKVLEEVIPQHSEIFQKLSTTVQIIVGFDSDTIGSSVQKFANILNIDPNVQLISDTLAALIDTLTHSFMEVTTENKYSDSIVSQAANDYFYLDTGGKNLIEKKSFAISEIKNIQLKLDPSVSVQDAVDSLIGESVDPEKLCQMFLGWMSFC